MNAFEQAWTLLKMTPDEMRQQGFGAAAEQLEEMKQQEAHLNEQRQAEQQRQQTMQPRVQQYNLQLAQREAQRNMNAKIRRARKDGIKVSSLFPEISAFEQEHGKLPLMPKNMKRRYLQYRAKMEED